MPKPRPPCGTQRAYQYHVRHHETACDPCLAAERRTRAAYRHPPGPERQAVVLGQLIALIAAECQRAGFLPADFEEAS